MSRECLSGFVGRKIPVTATVTSLSKTKKGSVKCLLTNIWVYNKFFIDHMWVSANGFKDIEYGTVIEFKGTVKRYEKISKQAMSLGIPVSTKSYGIVSIYDITYH